MRFDQGPTSKDAPAFDYVRASTTLTLSAMLIALATSFKLPLSTTYVTFMVAMGAALADGARGRDSAVYRISGVITIIGSWLLTAVISLAAALLLTLVLRYTGFWAVGIATLGVGYIMYRSYFASKDDELTDRLVDALGSSASLVDILSQRTQILVSQYADTLTLSIAALLQEDSKALIDADHNAQEFAQQTQNIKRGIHRLFGRLEDVQTESGHTYVQGVEFLRKATLALATITSESKAYVQNNHPEFTSKQHKELGKLAQDIDYLIEQFLLFLDHPEYALGHFDVQVQDLLEFVNTLRHSQFTRIKTGKSGVRNTSLYTSLLAEAETLLINLQKLLHYQRAMHP